MEKINYNYNYDNIGRLKVKMPVLAEEFYEEPLTYLKKHLANCIGTHNCNVNRMAYLDSVYKGNHDIKMSKKRYDSSEINNINVENHLKTITDFKTAFMYGIPLDYSIMNADNNDDMKYLNAYFVDSNKSSLDIKKAKDVYKYGLAYQMILPKKVIGNIEKESPFTIKNLPVESTCMVYSDDIPSEKLFALVIASKRYPDGKRKKVYNVFMPNRKILLDYKFDVIEDETQFLPYIPIVEFTLDDERMGILEVGIEAQNALNKADSMQLDEIEENINSFIAFFNQRVDDDFLDKFDDFKKKRVLLLNTLNPETPADIKMLSCDVNSEAHNLYYERKKKALYDICTTPQGSGNVTSGGDTGQARLLGNGWEAAQNQAQLDQTALLEHEREIIRIVLKICSAIQDCPINEIGVSDIAIKFNINMSNNLLVKAEAVKMLNEAQMPEKTILKVCNITNDIDGEGNNWIANKEKIRKQEMEQIQAENEQEIETQRKIGF